MRSRHRGDFICCKKAIKIIFEFFNKNLYLSCQPKICMWRFHKKFNMTEKTIQIIFTNSLMLNSEVKSVCFTVVIHSGHILDRSFFRQCVVSSYRNIVC